MPLDGMGAGDPAGLLVVGDPTGLLVLSSSWQCRLISLRKSGDMVGSGCPVPLKFVSLLSMNWQLIFPMLCPPSDDGQTKITLHINLLSFNSIYQGRGPKAKEKEWHGINL